MNYHKNDLIDECLTRFYQTFLITLDTADYVPDKYNEKILKYIFKNMKKAFGKINREDRRWQREHAGEALPLSGVDSSAQDEPQEVAQPVEIQENENIEVENNE